VPYPEQNLFHPFETARRFAVNTRPILFSQTPEEDE
jgi:hypothetical protein